MDAARAAAQSWPSENPQFRRTWLPPPLGRERAPPAQRSAHFGFIGNNSTDRNSEKGPRTQLPAWDRLRLQRGAEHIVRLGPRSIAELLQQIGDAHGCLPEILDVLDTWRARLTPEAVEAAGGDRFAPELTTVPR